MRKVYLCWSCVAVSLISLSFAGSLTGQAPEQRPRQGFQGGQGGQGGNRNDPRFQEDRDTFHFLLSNHDKIRRSVTELDNGIESLTESDVEDVTAGIQEHAAWMKARVETGRPIRMRDPLFAEIFRNASKIKMECEDTERGVRVRETSDDPKVVRLIKEHAKVVSKFVEHGHVEAMKQHPLPGTEAPTDASPDRPLFPVIQGHGGVIRLPQAAHQPREGTKLVIDVTKGAEPDQLNAAIAKVARYLNIYAGAGAEPVAAKMAMIFHGDATLAVLNPDQYKERFGVANPNLELLQQLHEADVAIYVCGQSLNDKDAKPDDVAVFVETAVSALTVVVNLQADGYSYLPLAK